jgi:hypothetical protein
MDINRRAALCLAMICPSCRNDNRPEARFCGACGQSMSAAPAPARDLRAGTPQHLADKILSSGAALEGERKQVTVFFADVKGSMDLAGTPTLYGGSTGVSASLARETTLYGVDVGVVLSEHRATRRTQCPGHRADGVPARSSGLGYSGH